MRRDTMPVLRRAQDGSKDGEHGRTTRACGYAAESQKAAASSILQTVALAI